MLKKMYFTTPYFLKRVYIKQEVNTKIFISFDHTPHINTFIIFKIPYNLGKGSNKKNKKSGIFH